VLVVHLKRFSYTSRLRDKLTTPVDFPLEGLDLSAHLLTGQPVPPVYDLFAVSNHMGGLGGGHYTAYAKQPGTEQWYCFDDSRVSEVPADQVVSPNAYVLFYHRRQEAADRSNALTEVLRAEEAAKDGV
jgi:ubiquitin C-terminal hydrolase